MSEVVYRILAATFNLNGPLEILIGVGYIPEGTTDFHQLNSLTHQITVENTLTLLTGSVDPAKTLIENLTIAMGSYLIANAVIDGELV